jgi:hypothetical protein
MLGLNRSALEDIVQRGKLQVIRRGKKNNGRCTSRRIPRAAVEKFLQERMGLGIAEEQALPTNDQSAPVTEPESAPKRRGRRTGSVSIPVRKRNRLMADDWLLGKYESVKDLAAAYGVDRTTASKALKSLGIQA